MLMHTFLEDANSSIGGRQPYVSCKHMCKALLLVFHADEEDGDFIHWSLASLEKLLSHDPMI